VTPPFQINHLLLEYAFNQEWFKKLAFRLKQVCFFGRKG
jgi:hypothetical protein